jgi:mono/diheme cytochrome c family protein
MFGKLNLLLCAGIALCLGSIYFLRRDYLQPNYELVTERQMARSPAFGSFTPNPNFPDGITLRQPVHGTIPRGWEPFNYAPQPLSEATRAGRELKNPLSLSSPHDRKLGASLYATYCQCCHGPTGMGDGPVSRRGFPPPLDFLKPQAIDLKDGEMFHILTFGKGNMPPHALQLSPTDRWAVILHVRALQSNEIPRVQMADTIKDYQRYCAACHGLDGTGVIRANVPYLPDFSNLAWQFTKTNLELTNRIEYGDAPHMPAFRYTLTRDRILGLAVYIRSFAVKEGGLAPKPALPPSPIGMKPEQIFRAYCMACHNADGKGAIVRPGMPDIPDFTQASWQQAKKDAELSKAILSGGKFMPPMKDKLTPEDADKMAKFVREFKDGKYVLALESSVTPKKEADIPPEIIPPDVEKFPPLPAREKPDATSPALAARLRSAGVLFREYCIVCHGPDGTGMATMRPALPTLPDFTKTSFRDQHSDPQLLISILDGKGTLMPANRGRVSESQARDLVAYIRAFAPPVAGAGSETPNDFQTQFEQLQRQWEALERDIRALKGTAEKKK